MKKMLLHIFLVCITVLSATAGVSADENIMWKEFYVSNVGDDANDGTSQSNAFKTIARAQEAVREISGNMLGNIAVNILADGDYILDEPLYFHSEDSATNGYRIIFRGIKDEEGNRPLISGGTKIENFVPSEKNPNLWQAQVTDEDIVELAAIYVGNRKAFMAASERLIHSKGHYYEQLSDYKSDGMYISKADIGAYENPEDMLAYWDVTWKSIVIPVTDIKEDKENTDRMIMKLQQPDWSTKSTASNESLTANPNRAFWLLNALELLDVPGEFYFNKKTRTVYYYPREDEDMKTVKVWAPKLDKLVRMVGNDVDDKVSGISFEGLEFAHSSFNGWLSGTENSQATYTGPSNGVKHYAVGAIELEFAKDISFTDSYFFGLGECGISMNNAVENATVVGNTFADIGGCAVTVGLGNQHQDYLAAGRDPGAWAYDAPVGPDDVSDPPPEPAPSDLNLIDGWARVWTSSKSGAAELRGKYSFFDEKNVQGTYNWTDGVSPKNGEKTWVIWDFEEPYNINKIRIYFDPKKVSAAEKTGYEVLLSNDFLFREGKYTVAATQETAPGNFAVYDREDNEKYRYMMIRTLGATPLRLSGVWAHTADRELFSRYQRCAFIDVSNNYMIRAGADIHGWGVLHSYAMNDSKFEHNEIIGAAYSAIACGWGWAECTEGSYRNSLSFNYIKDTNLTLEDGAPIYVMYHQKGSVMEGNFAEHSATGKGAYYFDTGASLFTLRNNAAYDVGRVGHEHTEGGPAGVKQFYETPFYSDSVLSDQDTNKVEPITYVVADPIPEVKAIRDNAGLQPQYEYLRSLTEDTKIRIASYYELSEAALSRWGGTSYLNSTITEAFENILAKDAFGRLPGQFPVKYKHMIENAVEEMKTTNAVEVISDARSLYHEVTDAFYRLPLNELIEEIENVLAQAKAGTEVGCYSEKEISALKKELSSAKANVAAGLDETKSYVLLQKLEKAYHTFDNARVSTDIEYLYTKDMVSCEIDREKGEILLTLPYSTDVSKPVALEFIGSGDAVAGADLSAVVLREGCKIPVYSSTAQEYKMWSVKAVYEQSDENSWNLVKTTEDVNTVETANGVLLLPRNIPYINMVPYTEGMVKSIKFAVNAKSGQSYDDVRFILNAASSKLEMRDDGSVNDRIEVVFGINGVSLYEIRSGASKLIDKSSAKLLTEGDNVLSYSLDSENEQTLVTVWLNGKKIISGLSSLQRADGLTGICSDVTAITVK